MSNNLLAAASGLGTGLSLIIAIGAQNAFVLRQGIRREHVPMVVAICTASDAILIALGVGGVGALVKLWPGAVTAVSWVGGAFLVGYGLLAARRALRPGRLDPGRGASAGPRATMLTCLALTWLNPHVYLDTVLLLGSIANSYGPAKWMFGLGAITGSVLWFSGLGFGARLLDRFFSRPAAWRALDGVIAATMFAVAASVVGGA